MVPRLRFPEFWDTGDWDEIKLIDTTDKKIKWSFIGGPFGSNLKSSDFINDNIEGIRVIQLQNIGDGEFINESKIFTSIKKAEELLSNNIYPGDIIMSKMGEPVGRACIIPNTHARYVMCSDGIRLVIDKKNFSKYFIYSLINSYQFRTLVDKTATGSTRKRIGLSDLKKLPLVAPQNLDEQQKIAKCLLSLDDLLTAHSKKLDALKDHKKGLLQQFFPAEGEQMSRLRFEKFKGGKKWIKKNLGDIGKPLMCKRIFKEQTTRNPKNAIPFYKIGTFGKESDAYIPISIYKEYKRKFSYPNVGDVLISASGTIGRLVVYDGEDAYYQDSNIVWLGHKEEDIINSFLFYCYSTLNWQTSDGGVIKRLYNSNLKEMEVFFPEDKKEQQKISNSLSSLDKFITAQREKIEALKRHKKGLLQQLFPNPNE